MYVYYSTRRHRSVATIDGPHTPSPRGPTADEQPSTTGATSATATTSAIEDCGGRTPVEIPAPSPPNDGASVTYLTCADTLESDPLPVYAVPAAAGQAPVDTSTAARAAAAVRTWLDGPPPKASDDGLGVLPVGGIPEGLVGVTVDGNTAFVNFAHTFADAVANISTTGSQRLEAELAAVILQFDDIDQAQLQLEGSCERFGELLESGCLTLTRPA